jgi:hypothetical protein
MVNERNEVLSVFNKKYFYEDVYSHFKNKEWISDPFIGFKLKKLKKILNKKIILETNQLGLRTSDNYKQKNYKIIFLGGSFVFGSYSPTDSDTIPKHYENLSKERSLNAGIGGHVLKQHFSLYFNYLYKNQPNKIFLIFGFNDMTNCFNNKKPEDLRISLFQAEFKTSFYSLFIILILKIITSLKIDFIFNLYKNFFFSSKAVRISNDKKKYSGIEEYCNELVILLNNFKSYCLVNEISLITILQPSLLLTKKKLNSYEENYMKTVSIDKITFAKKFYYTLGFKLSNFHDFYNFTNIYDDINKGIFVDEVHVGDRGNAIFAKKIYKMFK